MSGKSAGTDYSALAASVLAGDPPVYHPNIGQPLEEVSTLHPAAEAGLDVPSYCRLCGRRMVVQVRPDGWRVRCSRHGELDSSWLFVETIREPD